MTKWSPNGNPLSTIYLILSLFTLAHTAPTTQHSRTTTQLRLEDEDGGGGVDEDSIHFVKGQMEKYGYLKGIDHSSPQEFRQALMFFQEVLEVEQTGNVDEMTVEAASKPRCTQTDVRQEQTKRTKRFTLSKRAKWAHASGQSVTLKWYISDYTSDIDRLETRKVVEKAFKLWSSQSYIKNEKKVTLTFQEASSKDEADINILWAEGNHGDEHDFDGANGKIEGNKKENVLAHTFFPGYARPLNGDIHFDDAEDWEIDVDQVGHGSNKRFFPYVLAHEIGHALGLDHSQKADALMHPYYKNVPINEIQLDIDDKCGVIWNYGGASDFCLYVWLMSQIVEAHNSSAQNNHGVGSITSSRTNKKSFKNSKIPKCSSNNSSQRTRTGDLQRQWLTDYHDSREKSLVALTEKLHQEFMEDQERVRRDLLVQFKIELDQTKEELEKKHAENLKEEIEKLSEKHQRELAVAKKKQWCWQCNSEAIYHCCWNTAYCSVECQQGHWQIHRKFCRRKKSNGGAPGPVQPIAEPTQSQQ